MFKNKAISTAFFISLLGHLLFLSVPGFNFNLASKQKKTKDITMRLRIENPLLPKIDVMGKEKKLKEVKKEDLPKSKSKLEPKSEEAKIPQELKKQIEEIVKKEPRTEPLEEKVKVMNAQKEAMLRYQDMIKQRIESFRSYPVWAKKQGFEGITHLKFVIMPDGQARDITIICSSAFDILDREAVSTVRRASPFLPIPKDLNVPCLIMEVSIVFKLN